MTFFKTCERCGGEIADWDSRTPIHCIRCGVETGSVRAKFASKWQHHLNVKYLRWLYDEFRMTPFERPYLITINSNRWGYNLAVDDILYYLIRAQLVDRLTPGVYKITKSGLDVIHRRVTRKQTIERMVELEYNDVKQALENNEYVYLRGMT